MFTTIFEMCVFGSYLAYNFEKQAAHRPHLPFRIFISYLSHQLIFNIHLEEEQATRAQQVSSSLLQQVMIMLLQYFWCPLKYVVFKSIKISI